MIIHHLLLRGMLVGVVAGLLAFGFARVFGEPAVAQAIAFEAAEAKTHAHEHSEAMGHTHAIAGEQDDAAEPELVSRPVQAGWGLLTGTVVYGAALGGLFSLVFAFCHGRVGRLSPRACAALIAVLGFIAVYAVPYLKYPANPPAVGQPDTIGIRTALYFSTIVLSVAAMMTAVSLSRLLVSKIGGWNAALAGIGAFVVMVSVALFELPVVNEVSSEFPASTLWSFRLASFGLQGVLWATIGLLFGALTERSLKRG